MRRRHVLRCLSASAMALGSALGFLHARSQPREIELVARRWRYEPQEITLRAGEPVVIAIRSPDFLHGMNIPELKRRLDLIPGRVTRLELPALEPGIIDFVCDNFCGDGHEEMHGRFVIEA